MIIGFIGGEVVGKMASVVWGGIKGLFSFLQFGEIAKGILGGLGAPHAKTPWWKDVSWILPIACVAGILLMGGLSFIRETATTAAIVAEKEKGGGEIQSAGKGEPHSADPGSTQWYDQAEQIKRREAASKLPVKDYCANNPSAAMCQIKSCPEGQECVFPILNGNCGHISQGPASAFTHKGEWGNAVDFASPIYTPIFSLIDGVVVDNQHWSYNKFADKSAYPKNPDGNYVGNSVVIESSDGIQIVVGHLAYNSMPSVGTKIVKGQTVVGRIGETGSSTGPHTHIGIVRGDINIMELLPECPIP